MMRLARLALCLAVTVPGIALAQDYSAAMARGAHMVKFRNYPRALEAFQEAVAADPYAVDAYFNAGSLAQKVQRCRDVILYYRGFLNLSQNPSGDDDRNARTAAEACEKKAGFGTVTFRTETPGIEVFVGGALVGKTPVTELKLVPGTYRVEYRHPDYEILSEDVTVEQDKPYEETRQLVKKILFGYLDVKTVPADGVQVFLDGVPSATTPIAKKLRLETRKILVRLVKPGYDDFVRNVTIERDRVHTLTATLEAVQQPAETPPAPAGK
jgi:tetratricopeptide (TPR) repeat protein